MKDNIIDMTEGNPVKLLISFSIPMLIGNLFQQVYNLADSVIVGQLVGSAAFTATSRIEQIIHLPYQTLSAALSTFCGQNYGAKKIDRAILGYKKATLLMGIFTLVMFPIIQLGGESIIRFFVKKNEVDVIKMGATALKITSLFYFSLGTIYMVRGILYGVGDAFFSMLNGIVEVFGRFTAPFILTKIPFIGLWGIWWSVGFVWSIAGLTAWWRYIIVKRRIKKQHETKA